MLFAAFFGLIIVKKYHHELLASAFVQNKSGSVVELYICLEQVNGFVGAEL